MQMQIQTLTIVGVGLIGGSIGLAAKKHAVAAHIRGVDRDSRLLAQAQRLGAIDESSLDLAEAVRGANWVIYCTPVDGIARLVLSVQEHYSPATIITDVGSTKAQIVNAITEGLRDDVHYLGSHPLAGSEKQGVEHASADLFVKRWTVLTPVAKSAPPILPSVRSFWQRLGANTCTMSPEEHDRAVAMTSHLPHLVASALAGILPGEWRELAATGFRDTTRIAAGDAAVWTPIFQQNRSGVLAALTQLEERLQIFRLALQCNDVAALDLLLTQGKKVRDALGS